MPIEINPYPVLGIPKIKIEYPGHTAEFMDFGVHLLPMFTLRELLSELWRRVKARVKSYLS